MTGAALTVDTIDIALGFDANYAPHAAAVIASVVAHAPRARFRFIILHAGLDAALQARIAASAPGMSFIWIAVSDDDMPPFAGREHFSRAILFRLGLEKLAPQDCARVIYLDADITVLADVRELWAVNLDGAPVAAAIDGFVDPRLFAEAWRLPPGPDYFNSGVLVIDLARVRREGLFSKAIDFFVRNDAQLTLADQDALNWACWGRWTRIGVAWNAQRHMAIPSLIADIPEDRRLNREAPKIIHFTGPEKPWTPGAYHPWAWQYWKSLKRTAFARDARRAAGVGIAELLRLRLRWLLRRPGRLHAAKATGASPRAALTARIAR